jgi:hypothetical protein
VQDDFPDFQRSTQWLQTRIGQRIDYKIANSPRGFMTLDHTKAGIGTAVRRALRWETDLKQTKLFPI